MRGILIAAASIVVAQVAFGDELTRSVQGVTAIVDGEGSGRILFKMASPIDLPDIAVQRALLRVTTSGAAGDARWATLLLHPVTHAWSGSATWTTPWARPGGDFDDDLYAKREWNLAGGDHALVFDLTPIVKEIVEHGMASHGFILTVDPSEGEGLRTADLTRFQGLSSATLTVQYRRMDIVARG